MFYRIPSQVMGWTVCKLGVDEWLVSSVMYLCMCARTVVRTVCDNIECFEAKVGITKAQHYAFCCL